MHAEREECGLIAEINPREVESYAATSLPPFAICGLKIRQASNGPFWRSKTDGTRY